MSQVEFNPEQLNFPIYSAEFRNIPDTVPINFRLWLSFLPIVMTVFKEKTLFAKKRNGNGSRTPYFF